MKKAKKIVLQIIILLLIFSGENHAQQKDYLNGIDSNLVITVSNYSPKLNEIVTIQVKYYVTPDSPRNYMSLCLDPDQINVANKNLEILSKEKLTTSYNGKEVEIITMKVKFNLLSIYKFYTFYNPNGPHLIIPIYVEGRLPKSDPMKEIRDRFEKLKQNVQQLKGLSDVKKTRQISNHGLEYIKPMYNPKTDYERQIYKDILELSKIKYDDYKREFDALYMEQNKLIKQLKEKSLNNKKRPG